MELRIRELREEKGWNQTVLGYHAGLSPSQISLIETGKRNPSATTLQGIAGALGVEVGDLFPKVAAPRRSGPSEKSEDAQRELSIGPGSKELRRVEHELKPGTSLDEALTKLTTPGEGALGVALADLVFGEWSDDEASNSAAHKAASRIAKKTNTDLETLLKRVVDRHKFVARRIEDGRERQRTAEEAGEEETA